MKKVFIFVLLLLLAVAGMQAVLAQESGLTGVLLFTHTYEDTAWVFSDSWNPEQPYLLTYAGKTAYILDIVSGDELIALEHADEIWDASWSQDGTRILTASYDGTAKVWDASTGQEMLSLEHNGDVYTAAWNKDESRILTNTREGVATVWDASGTLLSSISHGQDTVLWDDNGLRVITWSWTEPGLLLWDALSGEQLANLPQGDWIQSAQWSPDQTRILTSGDDGTARIWDGNSGEQLLSLNHPGSSVYYTDWSKDQTRVLTMASDHTTHVWDAANGTELFSIEAVWGPSWNKDESQILTSSEENNAAQVWDANSGEELLRLQHGSPVSRAMWSSSETKILTTTGDGAIHIWDAVSGEELLSLSRVAEFWLMSTNQADSQLIVVTNPSSGGMIQMWDISQGVEVPVAGDGEPVSPKPGHWIGQNPSIEFDITEDQQIINFSAVVPFVTGSCSVNVADTAATVSSTGYFMITLSITTGDQIFIGAFDGQFTSETSLGGTYAVSMCGDTMSFNSASPQWQAQWVND